MAIGLNVGYAAYNNGYDFFEGPTDDEKKAGPDGPLTLRLLRPREGDSATMARNITILLSSPAGDMTGLFQMEGKVVLTMAEDKVVRIDEGRFELSHSNNGTVDVALGGSLDRTIVFPAGTGSFADAYADVTTNVIAQASKGPPIASYTDTLLRLNDALRSLLPWNFLTSGLRELRDGDGWTLRGDAVIEGLSLPSGQTDILCTSEVFEDEMGPKAVLTASCSPLPDLHLGYVLTADGLHSVPVSLDARARGEYTSDEGPVCVEMRAKETLISWSRGDGRSVDWPVAGNVEDLAGAELLKVGAVPEAGSSTTSFVSLPAECLEFAEEESAEVDGFIGKRGPVSPLRLSYYRNESRPTDRSWAWNITVGSSATYPERGSLGITVNCIEGTGILDQGRMELTEVRSKSMSVQPPAGRRMLSLSSHESLLRTIDKEGSFFTAAGYSQSYRLEMLYRGDLGPDAKTVLLHNMLGIDRCTASDLYISSSNDRLDPKTICIAVVDGSNGDLISTSRSSGSFPLLLKTYGLEPA